MKNAAYMYDLSGNVGQLHLNNEWSIKSIHLAPTKKLLYEHLGLLNLHRRPPKKYTPSKSTLKKLYPLPVNPITPVQINIVHCRRKRSSLKGIIVSKYIFASPQFCHVWVIFPALGREETQFA